MKTDEVFFGSGIALDATPSAKPKWNQLAKQGAFKGHSAGPFELSLDTFSQILDNFKSSKNQRIPIDFNHASEQDPTQGNLPTRGAPAVGWIVDMKIEGGNLWGLVQWGDLARQYILEGGYRYFSPAIRFNTKDRVTGKPAGARMSSGACTNDPFLSDMQPLAASASTYAPTAPAQPDHEGDDVTSLTAQLRGAGMSLTAAANAAHRLATRTHDRPRLSVDVAELESRLSTEETEATRRLLADHPAAYGNGLDFAKAKEEIRSRTRRSHTQEPSEAITALCWAASSRTKAAHALARSSSWGNGKGLSMERPTWTLPMLSDRRPWSPE